MKRARLTSPLRYAAVGLVLVLTAACGSGSDDESAGGGGSASTKEGGTVTVLAAASLTEALTTLGEQYEKDHPGVKVELSFGSSTTLATQIAEGAPADVAAFAGTKALDLVPPDALAAGGQETIAKNSMEIATPTDNPGQVSSLADLAKKDLDVVLCADTVPCGSAADEVLKKAGITANVVSRELDVKATLSKVELGEADAAVVYHSDVVTAGDRVAGVEIPDAENTTLEYPIIWLNQDTHAVGFAQFVASDAGEKVLVDAGFLAK